MAMQVPSFNDEICRKGPSSNEIGVSYDGDSDTVPKTDVLDDDDREPNTDLTDEDFEYGESCDADDSDEDDAPDTSIDDDDDREPNTDLTEEDEKITE